MDILTNLLILMIILLIADLMENQYKDIYFVDDDEGRRFYKIIKPVGSWQRRGCEHYALWKPVNRFLWVFWIRRAQDFWLDMDGFQKFNGQRLTEMKHSVN